ncbi:MetQ/NlpA family ABC transporter substrate-binding protein [Anaerococcus sp.]|uniref:MetQ/NlpA family ABC transporter substrate-binding protein n=1 Tax=Anaerococcus sp. TaxID=1872515 RepID=UPI00257FC318|nr:MetQ/NlpA family ABC transporter substrate-binding protein [Anaerococcus sp.]MBS6106529.1 MetQ/NlpA family ABC transporter substrate-binding protein [Anaerococcus sp.]MDU2599726.1 MetQ/NlpA family ABC transporter substrate-binding protein [Anaerococcus sp.]
MNNLKSISLVFALILGLSSCGANNEKSANDSSENKNQIEHASTDPLVDKDVIKLGVVGENNEDWDDVAKRYKQGTGKTIEIVAFSDYREPNEALLSGDIDINAFQHKKFLSQFNEESGSDIVDIADTSIAPLGIYSSKIDDLADLEDGARIAIPDDPTNGARSLFLLQSAGLIEVEGKDGDPITVDEITANPRNFEIVELSASQTARSLDDVDIACVNSGMAVDAGFVPTEDAIYLEDHNDPNKQIYVNVIATTKENENSKVLKDLIDNYYHQDATKKIINEVSKGSSIPVW